MHIAYLTPEYPHLRTGHSGGMGTSIKNLVMAIVKLGHQVSVFVYGQDADIVFEEEGVCFHKIKQQQYALGGFYWYRKHIEQYVNQHAKDVDIIEAPDWTGITAFMKLQKPLVIRLHGSDTYFCHLEGRKQKAKNAFFEKNAIGKARAFIAPTKFAGIESLKHFNQSIDNMTVIPYGLALENFKNNLPEVYHAQNILNVGTLIRKKGVFQLIEMFNRLIEDYPKATLTFIGADSPDVKTGALSTWALMQSKLSIQAQSNVNYLGKVPYDEVQKYMKNAHVCVFPSLAETLGMVTIEAMSLKKVVINTNLGWAKDLIDHEENGFMFHPDEIEKYVTTISRVFENDHLRTQIGNSARQKVERDFDINKQALVNIRFYKSQLT